MEKKIKWCKCKTPKSTVACWNDKIKAQAECCMRCGDPRSVYEAGRKIDRPAQAETSR